MNLRIDVSTKGALLSGKAPEVIQKGLDRFVTKTTMFLLPEVQKRTPQGVYGAQGGLLGSIQAEVTGKGTPVVKGVVMSAQKYAEVIEKGRTAGKGMPPKGTLVRWIETKLGLDEKNAQRIEFVIRRKIGLKGFEGRHMFEKAVTDNLGRIEAMAQAEGLIIATELNS
jgi:hypothetical protein